MIQQFHFWIYTKRNEIRVLRSLSKHVHNSIINHKPKGGSDPITSGTFLVGQWVRFCTSPAGGVGSTPGLGTKFLQGVPCGQKVKRKKKPFWTSFIRLKAENSEPLYYLPQIPFAEMHPQRPHSMSSPHIYLPSVWHPWKLKTFSFVLSPLHKCIGLC